MKFHELEIENFLTLKSERLSLSDKGLVLIQGKNLSDPSAVSNGAGKSSIVDALCWCLFGETARGESGDAVVNNITKKDCMVSLRIEDDGKFYSVTRYRKHKVGKNVLTVYGWMEDGIHEMRDISKGTDKETQLVVNQVLGCSYDVFVSAIYAGQEKMPDIPSMTDKQLKLLIEEASGVTRLSDAYELAKKELNDEEATVKELTTLVAALNRSEVEKELLSRTAAERAATWTKEQFSLIDLCREAISKKRLEVSSATPKSAEDTRVKLAKEKDSIHREIEGIEKSKEPRAALEAELVKLGSQIAVVESKRRDAEKEVTKTGVALDKVDSKVGMPCSECAKPYTKDDLTAVTNLAQAKVQQAKEQLAKCEVAHGLLQERVALQKEKLDTVPIISFGELVDSLKRVSEEIELQSAKFAAVKLLEAELEVLVTALMSLEVADNPHLEAMREARKAHNDAVDAWSMKKEALSDCQRRLDLVRDSAKVFGPAGVRAHILDTVTPFLNDRTSHYLGVLSDGNISANWSTLSRTGKGEIREKFCIDVLNEKGSSSFRGLSGGEKRKVRLACTLALQDLVSTRATKSIQLWVGDEIDTALDDAGLERLMTILNDKAKERGTVIVISHNALRDWCDNVAEVTKGVDGYSTIDGALSA